MKISNVYKVSETTFAQKDHSGEVYYHMTDNILTGVGCEEGGNYPSYMVLPSFGEAIRSSSYISGNLLLAIDAFEGVKEGKVVIPRNMSVKFREDTFDPDARIEIIAPEGYAIKKVVNTLTNKHGEEHITDVSYLIADESTRAKIKQGKRVIYIGKNTKKFLNVKLSNTQFVRDGQICDYPVSEKR